MNRLSRAPEADPLYARPAAERPSYSTGMLLDAQDFTDEQTYHRGRLARVLASLTAGGTLAGLRVSHGPATAAPNVHPEEIRVEPGLAIDRLGRLIEVPRPACLRLQNWFDAEAAADGGDRLRQGAYTNLNRFLSARAIGEAGSQNRPPIPARGVVADVFLRFIACARGLSPSFATGPFEALDAVATSRVRDAYDLHLIVRQGLDDAFNGLPAPGVDLAGIADLAERRARLQDAILDSYPASGRAGSPGELDPLPEHPAGVDRTAVFLARVVVPVGAANPPARAGTAVLVDGWRRRFIPSSLLVSRWIGV
ncbi:MAG TPA: hypothetical protein VFT24_04310 [Vicinamibacterales bacterium]|nr:hypothetical protein [Vicinamibacterales bacterium]